MREQLPDWDGGTRAGGCLSSSSTLQTISTPPTPPTSFYDFATCPRHHHRSRRNPNRPAMPEAASTTRSRPEHRASGCPCASSASLSPSRYPAHPSAPRLQPGQASHTHLASHPLERAKTPRKHLTEARVGRAVASARRSSFFYHHPPASYGRRLASDGSSGCRPLYRGCTEGLPVLLETFTVFLRSRLFPGTLLATHGLGLVSWSTGIAGDLCCLLRSRFSFIGFHHHSTSHSLLRAMVSTSDTLHTIS